jgi:biotin/methionine sulfoxide reductase
VSGRWRTNSSHWGAFQARRDDGGDLEVRSHPLDPAPTPLHGNIASAAHHRARVARPAVRRGWLADGPGPSPGRGVDPFVEVSWDTALDLLSAELDRVYRDHGAAAVYGGSYGWASAGRFHHAQSQVHRFLNVLGGYVRSVHTYSLGASGVLLPHVIGMPAFHATQQATTWRSILEHTELIVAFGGLAVKNASVTPGGITEHRVAAHLDAAAARGIACELFSPLRDDAPAPLRTRWHPLRPGTDTAVMLGLAHTLVTEGLHDVAFLDRYCAGVDRFLDYLLGAADGQPKDAEWAARISELDAGELRDLARRMASARTLVQTSWSLQRAQHGEQPIWMAVALAALLGQIGLPGGGFGHGYASMGEVGATAVAVPLPSLPQGANPVSAFIPVARAADMLLDPGGPYDFDGQRLTYPDIRLVYWSGGNPFHHHQDLGRLRQAWARPDTIVVHEPYWTASARHADLVLPATTTLERDDLGATRNDAYLHAMQRVIEPYGEARDDFSIFASLTDRITGDATRFTEGRDERGWLEHLYDQLRTACSVEGHELPDFATFWEEATVRLPMTGDHHVLLGDFREDPERFRLGTPSGRIELASTTVAGFGYADAPGHPAWLPPEEWLGAPDEVLATTPLHLIANQPTDRLHSQLDMGERSRASKVAGREPIRLHPGDAAVRGIRPGDVVRVSNARGACLAGAVLSDALRPGVVQLATGAWYDPEDPAAGALTCVHGNPNVLTADRGTSSLSQGCAGQHALVQVERFEDDPPPVRAFAPPPFAPPPFAPPPAAAT